MTFQPHHQDDWSIISKENKEAIIKEWKDLEPDNLGIPNRENSYLCDKIQKNTWVLYYARNRAFGSTSYKLGLVKDIGDLKSPCNRDDTVFIDTGGMSGIAARYVRRMKAIPEDRVNYIKNLFKEAGDKKRGERAQHDRNVTYSQRRIGPGPGAFEAVGAAALIGGRKQKKRITKKRRKGRFTKKSNRKYNRKGNKSKRRRRK